MWAYVVRRLLLIIPVLIGVTLLVFAVSQMFTPEERASAFIKEPKQAVDIENIIQKYHLRDPVHVQYFNWLKELSHGNLGFSSVAAMPVWDALIYFLPNTAELALFTVILMIPISIWLGSISAVKQGKAADHACRLFAIVGWSLPSFWISLIFLMVFYGYFEGALPPEALGYDAGMYVHSANFVRYTRINTIDALLNGELWVFGDALRHLILPVLTLTIAQCAMIMRIMRSSMLESLGKGYITTARAKGASEKTVIKKHARRNAMIPVLTVSGWAFGWLMGGVVITETVFSRNGLGLWWAKSATQLDIPAILSAALFMGIVFVITNLIVDLLYAYMDPRVRLG